MIDVVRIVLLTHKIVFQGHSGPKSSLIMRSPAIAF